MKQLLSLLFILITILLQAQDKATLEQQIASYETKIAALERQITKNDLNGDSRLNRDLYREMGMYERDIENALKKLKGTANNLATPTIDRPAPTPTQTIERNSASVRVDI